MHAVMRAVAVKRSVTIDAPTDRVFDAVCGMDVPSIMRRTAFVPGVADVEGHKDAWSAVGQQRLLRLTDKSIVREELREFTPGAGFRYRIFGFSKPLSDLVEEGVGAFEITARPEHASELAWTYSLTPVTPLTELPVRLFLLATFPSYMRAALKRLKQSLAR